MTAPRSSQPGPDPSRLIAIASGAGTMAVLVFILVPRHGPSQAAEPVPVAPAAEPIPAEALVFRTRWGSGAAALDAEARPGARPRTLAFTRRLREYPGAPPRIPHGLTADEYRATSCNVCHERGGYAARFGAYTPVTPHAEYPQCLQCHVPPAMSVGVPLPGHRGEVVCRQCHVDPDRRPPSLVSVDWSPLAWPTLGTRAGPDAPPLIPHPLDMRSNCLACHAGPAAVPEIRTDHPERGNCRQCHLALIDSAGAFERAAVLP